jgi:hypothetical protein
MTAASAWVGKFADAVDRPIGICRNCHVVWKAAKPRPAVCYCWHHGNAARLEADRWHVLEAVSARALAEMRAKGEL